MKSGLNVIKVKDKEIDILELWLFVKGSRLYLLKIVVIFFIIGSIYCIGAINEYRSEATLLPEISNKDNGVSNLMKQFGNLSNLVGMDFNSLNSGDALNPSIYPEIISSKPFMIDLLNSKIYYPPADTTVSLLHYMNSFEKHSIFYYFFKYTIGLPSVIKASLYKTQSKVEVSYEDSVIMQISPVINLSLKELNKRIQTDISPKTGIISISAEFPNAQVSAQVAQQILNNLMKYISDYRLQKAKDNLEFISIQCNNAKKEYETAQLNLANFVDANKNIISAKRENEQNGLQSQFDLTFRLYNTLLQQREQAKLNVQQEMPIIKILNPVQVPIEKSKPNRSFIILFSIFIGISYGLIFILVKYINEHS